MIISKLNGGVWRLSFTINVQLCACEALPPLPPTDVVVEPVSTSVLRVTWRAPDQSNGRAITSFIVVCDGLEYSYVPYDGRPITVDYDALIENLTVSGAEYVIQVISMGPLQNSTAETVRQRTSKNSMN
jgi:hypothetical protein